MAILFVVCSFFLCNRLLYSEALAKPDQSARAEPLKDAALSHRNDQKFVAIGGHGDANMDAAAAAAPAKTNVPDHRKTTTDNDHLVKKTIDARGDFVPKGQPSAWKRSMPAASAEGDASTPQKVDSPNDHHVHMGDKLPFKMNTTGSKDQKVVNSTGKIVGNDLYGPRRSRKPHVRHQHDQKADTKKAESLYITQGYTALQHAGFNPGRILDLCSDDGRWTRQFMTVFPDATFVILDTMDRDRRGWSDLLSSGRVDATTVDVAGWTRSDGADGDADRPSPNSKIRSLDEFLTQTHRDKRFDLIRLGIHGSAVHILDGAEKVLKQAKVVAIEIPLFNPARGDATSFADHVNALDLRGFRPFDMSEAQRVSDFLMTMSVVWVRKNSPYAEQAQSALYNYTKAGSGRPLLQTLWRSSLASYAFSLGFPFLPCLAFLLFAKVLENPRWLGLSNWSSHHKDEQRESHSQQDQHSNISGGQVLEPHMHGGIMVPSQVGVDAGGRPWKAEGNSCGSSAAESPFDMCD
mmetsp:Transcript_140881/g.259450  ORF Transcript_140881/g.259450 Transcript_140881/m.259450 type:complete len:520 (+) Transcript_140881:29-1588(+)